MADAGSAFGFYSLLSFGVLFFCDHLFAKTKTYVIRRDNVRVHGDSNNKSSILEMLHKGVARRTNYQNETATKDFLHLTAPMSERGRNGRIVTDEREYFRILNSFR